MGAFFFGIGFALVENLVGVDREFTLMILGSPIGLWRLADGGFLFLGSGLHELISGVDIGFTLLI